jgi:hypothetical protein
MPGIEVAESAVGRYMVRRRRPPAQNSFVKDAGKGCALTLDLGISRFTEHESRMAN